VEVIEMGIAHELGKTIGKVMAPLRAGAEGLAPRRLGVVDRRTLEVTSPAFTDGGPLPVAFTADIVVDGKAHPPPLAWSNVPLGTRSFVIIAEDPDAPTPKPFVHWLAYELPAHARSNEHRHAEGMNSKLKNGYEPAAPPAGHGVHHYHFQVFALDTVLDLDWGAGRASLIEDMRHHVLAWGEIVATYERS
jgi:Raf kinase inhibitor-like YbhB/YbcL family protein